MIRDPDNLLEDRSREFAGTVGTWKLLEIEGGSQALLVQRHRGSGLRGSMIRGIDGIDINNSRKMEICPPETPN